MEMGNKATVYGKMGQKDWKRKLYFFELGVKCFAHKAQDFSRFGVIRPDFDQDSSDIFYLQLIRSVFLLKAFFEGTRLLFSESD